MARKPSILAPLVIGLGGVGVLLALGFWQVERLAWKEGLIAEVETRLAADPVALPADPDPDRDALLRVQVRGTLGTDELHAIDSIKRLGPGYRVIVPMEITGQGAPRRIMVDLGFVAEAQKDPATRPSGAAAGAVTGLLHWPEERDSFTPDPDTGRNIWFARDVPAMATALGTDPVLITAETHPLGDTPLPRPPSVDLPNRHLEYALTWFGLAAVWLVMAFFWARAERHRARTEG